MMQLLIIHLVLIGMIAVPGKDAPKRLQEPPNAKIQ